MDSLVSIRRPGAISRLWLGAALALLAACGSGDEGAVGVPAEMACNTTDLGGEFHLLTEGEVSVRNLADLADDAGGRARELRLAGLRGGRFSYWEEQVGRPPFDLPAQALCQALEFGSEAEAERFVRELRAEPGKLATTAMTWLPRGQREAEEVPLTTAPALPAGARAFRIAANGPGPDVELYAVFAPNGRYVQSVHVSGGRHVEDALAMMESLAGRTRILTAAR